MIIFPKHRLIFIHSPRTGGTALNYHIHRVVPDAIVRSHGVPEQHMIASTARVHYPGYSLVTITRNPWDVYASIWRMAVRVRGETPSDEWRRHTLIEVLSWANMSFPQWLMHVVARDVFRVAHAGGFTNTYADDNTQVLRFDDEPLLHLGQLLKVDFDPPAENCGATIAVQWTHWMIDLVGQQCHADIDEFGYLPPIAS